MAHVEAPSLWTWAAGRGQHETASYRGWEAWENVQRGLIFFNDIIDILSSCGRFPGGSDGKESACDILVFKNVFIYLFMTAPALPCYAGYYSLVAGGGASHCGGFSCGTGCQQMGFSSRGTWVYLPLATWNLHGPGIKSVFPALARFSTRKSL